MEEHVHNGMYLCICTLSTLFHNIIHKAMELAKSTSAGQISQNQPVDNDSLNAHTYVVPQLGK